MENCNLVHALGTSSLTKGDKYSKGKCQCVPLIGWLFTLCGNNIKNIHELHSLLCL
jgi:hypothetical protein